MKATIKVDEQGKLYWWDGNQIFGQWVEIAEESKLKVFANDKMELVRVFVPGTYTIEADGRFEVREEPKPEDQHFSYGVAYYNAMMHYTGKQLAYWVTDKD